MGVLNRLLQRIKPLTHLALLTHAVHEEPDSDDADGDDADEDSSPQVSSLRLSQSCVVMSRLPFPGDVSGVVWGCSAQVPVSTLHK